MDSIANEGTTRLVFEARVTGAKPVLAKASENYGGGTGGRLELTLTLDQPKAPRPPSAPSLYGLNYTNDSPPAMKPRPADIDRKKGESDEDYVARVAVVKRKDEQKNWDHDEARLTTAIMRYQQEKSAYDQAVPAHAARTMAYAQLVGICSVFGNMAMRVELTPLEQDLLPGFSVGLLPARAEGE